MSSMSSMRGESGKRDPELRSDCWIGCEIRESGGIAIDLHSKVASLYGEALRSQLHAGMRTLGLENAALSGEDGGALPCCLDRVD